MNKMCYRNKVYQISFAPTKRINLHLILFALHILFDFLYFKKPVISLLRTHCNALMLTIVISEVSQKPCKIRPPTYMICNIFI